MRILLFLIASTMYAQLAHADKFSMLEGLKNKYDNSCLKVAGEDCMSKNSTQADFNLCMNTRILESSVNKRMDKIAAGVDKVVAYQNFKEKSDRCLNETDPVEKEKCKAFFKESYNKYKEASRAKAAVRNSANSRYSWDGKSTGGDVLICTRGKNKPRATVLQVTPSKVKVEVTKYGGNIAKYYSEGEQVWLEHGQIGSCPD